MGIDFRIEDEPRYVVTGEATTCNGEVVWDNETLEARDLPSLLEDPPARADLHIRSVALEPPLPSGVAGLHASWAYSGFARFRERVALTIGIWLPDMCDWEDVASPLVPFLHHSDHDGEMTPAECAACAPALSEALENLTPAIEWQRRNGIEGPKGIPEHWEDNDVLGGRVLVAMMEACGRYGRRLLFR